MMGNSGLAVLAGGLFAGGDAAVQPDLDPLPEVADFVRGFA
jgi:hypothetical protein